MTPSKVIFNPHRITKFILFFGFVFLLTACAELPQPSKRGPYPGVFNLCPTAEEPARRIALLIGNGGYARKALNNPTNDAEDMAAALREAGFEVTQINNAERGEMETAIRDFGEQLKNCPNTVGLFYFAGHGMQYNGKNHLFPIGAMRSVTSIETLQNKTVGVDDILATMTKAKNRMNIIFLDACRDNPFRETLYRSKSRSIDSIDDQDGLAPISPLNNFLIAYSTLPNMIAQDGKGRNSPYVESLKKKLVKPDMRIEEMLRLVRVAVQDKTDQQQAPMYSAGLSEPFCFVGTCLFKKPPPPKPPLPLPPTQCAQLPQSEQHKVFRDSLKDGNEGPEMVKISAGSFKMGNIQGNGSSHEQPVHDVPVNKFAIGRSEITFADYDRFAEATGRNKPSDSGWGRDNRPVIKVSWKDATAYAEWLSRETGQTYRLPTEAEWEYAARAGTETQYWWGKEMKPDVVACINCNDGYEKPPEQSLPVCSFPPNPFGLYDTAGNVWEWTCSEYQKRYNGKEQRCADKNSNSNFHIVARGGSFYSVKKHIRSAYRFKRRTTERYNEFGFRLVKELN